MTVSTTTEKVTAEGNDTATVFSFNPLIIYQSSDLTVTLTDSTGADTLLTEGTGTDNYSVSVSSYPGTGSITYPASGAGTLPTGSKLTMKPVFDLTQESHLQNQGGYFPNVVETALDKLTYITQQQQEEINRAVKVSISSDINPDELIDELNTAVADAEAAATTASSAATTATDAATDAAASAASISLPLPFTSGGLNQSNADLAAVKTQLGIGSSTESFIVCVTTETAAVVAGTGKFQFRMPYAFTLTRVKGSLNVAQATGNILTIDVTVSGVSVFSTALTIDNTELTSSTATTPAVISTSSLPSDAVISIDVSQIGDGTAAGLKVELIGHQ